MSHNSEYLVYGMPSLISALLYLSADFNEKMIEAKGGRLLRESSGTGENEAHRPPRAKASRL